MCEKIVMQKRVLNRILVFHRKVILDSTKWCEESKCFDLKITHSSSATHNVVIRNSMTSHKGTLRAKNCMKGKHLGPSERNLTSKKVSILGNTHCADPNTLSPHSYRSWIMKKIHRADPKYVCRDFSFSFSMINHAVIDRRNLLWS